ncbi:MAG: hypothetical protein K9J42_05145 [Sulfuritalea sp.]|nr:hypothetical protein [Sulfuritalea sp.]
MQIVVCHGFQNGSLALYYCVLMRFGSTPNADLEQLSKLICGLGDNNRGRKSGKAKKKLPEVGSLFYSLWRAEARFGK